MSTWYGVVSYSLKFWSNVPFLFRYYIVKSATSNEDIGTTDGNPSTTFCVDLHGLILDSQTFPHKTGVILEQQT